VWTKDTDRILKDYFLGNVTKLLLCCRTFFEDNQTKKTRFNMKRYKSWPGLKKQLEERLCEPLKDRVTYFLTRYHEVHNSYGRASICLDGKELASFSWAEKYKQERDVYNYWCETGKWDFEAPELNRKWNQEATLTDYDFIEAATDFLSLSIQDALVSENYLIRVFAIMDKRIGKRTLEKF